MKISWHCKIFYKSVMKKHEFDHPKLSECIKANSICISRINSIPSVLIFISICLLRWILLTFRKISKQNILPPSLYLNSKCIELCRIAWGRFSELLARNRYAAETRPFLIIFLIDFPVFSDEEKWESARKIPSIFIVSTSRNFAVLMRVVSICVHKAIYSNRKSSHFAYWE